MSLFPEGIPMHDIKAIRDDSSAFVRGLTRRGLGDAQALADGLLVQDRPTRPGATTPPS
jgi:hypothetical protein